MYRKYCRRLLKPILVENGFYPSTSRSVTSYEKNIAMGMRIGIDIQRNKWYPTITININVLKETTIEGLKIFNTIEDYRLGHFSLYPFQDLWWSIEEEKIEESFQEVVNIMQNKLFPALEAFENEKFMEQFLANKKISNSLNFPG